MPRTRPGASIPHCDRDALHAAAPFTTVLAGQVIRSRSLIFMRRRQYRAGAKSGTQARACDEKQRNDESRNEVRSLQHTRR